MSTISGQFKRFRMVVTSYESSSEEVEGNYDMLSSILLKLPPKSVFRFRSVSKRWNSIFCDPFFIKSYEHERRNDQGNLIAFIQYYIGHKSSVQILPIISPQRNNNIMKIPSECGRFVDSCKGLVLTATCSRTYYIVNLMTGRWAALPLPRIISDNNKHRQAVLVCDENTHELVPNFRVIRVIHMYKHMRSPHSFQIDIYSSKNRTWAEPIGICLGDFIQSWHAMRPLVFNSSLHWISWRLHRIAVYDSTYYDNNDGNQELAELQFINLPDPELRNLHKSELTITRSSKDDVLWFSKADIKESIRFWMLPKDVENRYSTTIPKDEWILMHTIDVYSLCSGIVSLFLDNTIKQEDKCIPIYTTMNRKTIVPHDAAAAVAYIKKYALKLKALLPWNNSIIALINLGNIVFLYNFERNSAELVQHNGGFNYNRYWRLYTEPVSLCSYAHFNLKC